MNIKYYGRDTTVGHRDSAYFELQVHDENSPTGNKYVVFRLLNLEGKEMSEEVCEYLAKNIIPHPQTTLNLYG